MPALYPKMRERPDEFRINQAWPLRAGVKIAWCGRYANSGHQHNEMASSPTGYFPVGFDTNVTKRDPILNRDVILLSNRYLRFNIQGPSTSSTPFAISWWVKPRSPDSVRGLMQWFSGSLQSPFILIRTYQSPPTYAIYLNGGYRLTANMENGTWYHNVVQWNGKWQWLINGHMVGDYPEFGGLGRTMLDFGYGYNGTFDGFYADAIIWTGSALAPSEIEQLADPSNVDLRIGGIPLILPPRRRFWPVVSEQAMPKMVPWHLFQNVGV